ALPDTTITIRSGDTKIRWREPELARLPRASQALSPSPACALPLLQGVHLTDLLPARAGLAVIDAYVIQLGVLRTRRFAASQLAPGSDLMVADTRQRGFTDRLSPFAFSLRFRTATWRSSTTSAALRSKNTDWVAKVTDDLAEHDFKRLVDEVLADFALDYEIERLSAVDTLDRWDIVF